MDTTGNSTVLATMTALLPIAIFLESPEAQMGETFGREGC